MKEIGVREYENLREREVRLIGRAVPYDSGIEVIYFIVSPEQQSYGVKALLDELHTTHPNLKGQIDVIRHWANPEVVTINYQE